MAMFGGFSPFPLRFGGGAPLLQRVFESIAAQRGSAYDQTTQSAVGTENMAIARAITFDLYGSNERLANNMRPATMTAAGLLPRWEAIFDEPPQPGDTEGVRRARIAAAWANVGLANTHQPVVDALTATLGPLFTGTILYQLPGTALSIWPGASNATATTPWLSSIDFIAVQVQLAPGFSSSAGVPNAAFWANVAAMVPTLDAMLSSWITFDWFLQSSAGTNVFLLDDPSNLDTEVLS